MRRITGRLAAALLALGLAPAEAEVAACYSLPAPSGGVEAMTVTGGGVMTYAEDGHPLVLFSDFCNLEENGTTTCQLECDGGQLRFTHSADGLTVEATGRRIETIRFDSLLNLTSALDADGWNLDGRWQLVPADPAACRSLENRAPAIALGPGDVHPWVRELETYLLAGGLFLNGPDLVFDGETAEAVRRYQRSLGLEATGRADRALLQRIAADAVLAFGGC